MARNRNEQVKPAQANTTILQNENPTRRRMSGTCTDSRTTRNVHHTVLAGSANHGTHEDWIRTRGITLPPVGSRNRERSHMTRNKNEQVETVQVNTTILQNETPACCRMLQICKDFWTPRTGRYPVVAGGAKHGTREDGIRTHMACNENEQVKPAQVNTTILQNETPVCPRMLRTCKDFWTPRTGLHTVVARSAKHGRHEDWIRTRGIMPCGGSPPTAATARRSLHP
jgi:hypothetical protein